jgi:hypothetical protein
MLVALDACDLRSCEQSASSGVLGRGFAMPKFWRVLALALLPAGAIAADDNAVPPFMFIDGGWQAGGADFRQPESGPGPVKDIPGWVRRGNQEGVHSAWPM